MIDIHVIDRVLLVIVMLVIFILVTVMLVTFLLVIAMLVIVKLVTEALSHFLTNIQAMEVCSYNRFQKQKDGS